MPAQSPPDITYVANPYQGAEDIRGAQTQGAQVRTQKRDATLQQNDQARMNAMPTKQADAFMEGFVIKCAEVGIADPRVIADLLMKSAMDVENINALIGAGIGGLSGAGMGALSSDKGRRLRGAMVGGLAGAGVGAGLGSLKDDKVLFDLDKVNWGDPLPGGEKSAEPTSPGPRTSRPSRPKPSLKNNYTLGELLSTPMVAMALGGGTGLGSAYLLGQDPLMGGLGGAGVGLALSDKNVSERYPGEQLIGG